LDYDGYKPAHAQTGVRLDYYPAGTLRPPATRCLGGLVDQQGALPGAKSLISRLNDVHHPYLILTNSISRLPETLAKTFAASGLAIPAERILSSGMLLTDHFR